MTVKVVHNLSEFDKKINKIAKKAGNLELAHKRISIMLDGWVQRNFKSEGKSVGGWEPFKEYCAKGQCARGRVIGRGANRRIDTEAKLLQDTGRLRKSFLPFYSKKQAGIGSKVPYSEYHEKGEGHLPKRRMLPRIADIKKQVVRLYEHHLKEAGK